MGIFIAAAAGIPVGILLFWVISRLAGSGRKAELLARDNQTLQQELARQKTDFEQALARRDAESEEKLHAAETLWAERVGAEIRSAREEKENAEKARRALREEWERHAAEMEQHQKEKFERELAQKEAEHRETIQLTEKLWTEKLIAAQQSAATEKETAEKARKSLQEELDRRALEAEKHQQAKLELLKSEFKNLSEKLLEEKSGKLQHANTEQIAAILSPLKEKLTEFRTAVESSKLKGIELHAQLAAELKKMMEETNRIGGEARTLVNALKGQQKTQGDWGELILEEILQSSGLLPGVHYDAQSTIRDAAGNTISGDDNRKMRPDIIVHYPDERDVIIDSKVSLTAYTDYAAAGTPEARQEALARHIQSIKAHVTELAKKNYSAYWQESGRVTVDFVIMFVAPEGAFHLAMIESPTLWNEAFKQKVLIVSPANLMALLKIIHIAWEKEEQNRNQQAILDTAAQMLDRIYAFYRNFDEIGNAMEKMQKSYTQATHCLKAGNGNHSVVNSGEKLKQLGIRTKKVLGLPQRLQSPEMLPPPEKENQQE